MIRQPAVSGQFYPSSPAELRSLVNRLLIAGRGVEAVRAIVVPHAGYVYSGAVAGQVFAECDIPSRVVLIGPNHHGRGERIAVSAAEAWKTPLGDIPVDDALRRRLLKSVAGLELDDDAHRFEHSLEVMLPFLLGRRADVAIVPIALRALNFEDCCRLGEALATVLADDPDEVLLLASSDLNHFSPAETNEKLDALAIQAMTDYDLQELYQVVRRNRISMCGILPVVTVMQAARRLGASTCRLVRYAHSGMISGDNSSVVGYAGLTLR